MARGDNMYDDVDDLDAEQKPKTDGLASALVIVTTLMLLGAIVVSQMAMKRHFDENWFSKDAAEGAP